MEGNAHPFAHRFNRRYSTGNSQWSADQVA